MLAKRGYDPRIESHTVTLSGRRIHYLSGTSSWAPTFEVVLVPGLGMSADYLRPVADSLVTYCNVFIVELPGVGKSDKPHERLTVENQSDLLLEWTAATGVRKPLFAGNSFGSQVVADFAARYPQFTFGVVLLDPVIDPQHRSVPAQLGRFVRNAFREPLSLWRIAARDYLRSGPRALRDMFKSSMEDEIEQKLPKVSVPVLVVRGKADVLTTHEWAASAAALAPDGRLVEIDDAAHASMYAQGAEVAQVIRNFADSIRPSSPAAVRRPQRPTPKAPRSQRSGIRRATNFRSRPFAREG